MQSQLIHGKTNYTLILLFDTNWKERLNLNLKTFSFKFLFFLMQRSAWLSDQFGKLCLRWQKTVHVNTSYIRARMDDPWNFVLFQCWFPLSVSHSFSSLCLSLSLPLCLPLCLTYSISPSLSHSLTLSLSLYLSISLSLSHSLFPLSFSLSLTHSSPFLSFSSPCIAFVSYTYLLVWKTTF